MTSHSTTPDQPQSETETAVQLFDNWFDPIEAGFRDRAREFLQAMFEGELDEVLDRSRYHTPAAESGIYWPFGEPARLFESRPNYPLLLRQSELDALLSQQPAKKRPLPKVKIPASTYKQFRKKYPARITIMHHRAGRRGMARYRRWL